MAKNKGKKNIPALPAALNLGEQLEQQMAGNTKKSFVTDSKTADSFANLAGRLGIQNKSNLISHSRYDLGPFISRDRLQLEAMYRSSWLVGQVVDTVAEDMTRDGITMNSEMAPDDIQELQVAIGEFGIWQDLCANIKWGRLYGGSIAVILIDGADYEKPLDIEKVRKDQFKGLLVLDRWMLQPSLGELITDVGKDMGKPMYYEVLSGVNTFPAAKIHYTRVIRVDGIELPYYQKMFENFWGLSVVERMLDRLIAFDSASEGAAQLLYKLHLRVIRIKGFREALANGGKEEEAVIKQFKYIRLMQSNEGLTLLDADDEFQTHQFGGLRGMADMLDTFGQQISGATNIPLVRLFGQSPAGFSNGETDLRNYYDLVRKLQENQLREGLHKLLAVMAKSRLNKHLPEDFSFTFNSLWQISEMEKAQIASQDAQTQSALYGGGLITKVAALKEIRQQSTVTGRGTNITADDIKEAENEPPLSELMNGGGEEESFGGIPLDAGNAEAPEAENPNERMGGEDPDIAEGESNAEKENPIVKDSVKKKIKFRDKLKAIFRKFVDSDFKEEEHPRGQPDNAGQFVKGSGASKKTEEKTKSSLKEKIDKFKEKTRSSSDNFQPAKFENGKLISHDGKAIPEHISNAKIPPAWTDIVFDPDPKAELIVKGKDSKGRMQYVYSEAHWNSAAAMKFARIKELNEKFSSIEKQNEEMLKVKKLEEALIMKLIMKTGCRPGSGDDTQAKVKAYGATTLEGRHVKVEGDAVVLHFIGKKGVENNIPIHDEELSKELIERSKKVGADGKLFKANNSSLLDYAHTLDGGGFKTKDFRTLLGTKTAMELIPKVKKPTNEKEYKKAVMDIAKQVSQKLGNTPSVALKSYIAPEVFSEWRIK